MTGILRPVTEVTISAAFAFGGLLALPACLKLALSREPDSGERYSALIFAYNLALVPLMFLSGVLIDEYGVQLVLFFSSLVTALALLTLSYRPTVSRAFLALLLAGLGSAGLCISSIVLMPEAFFPGEPSASLNLGIVFFAPGALIAPILTDILLRSVGNRRALSLLALICLAPGVMAALTHRDDLDVNGIGSQDLQALLSYNPLWLAGLVFALYAPLEASISTRVVNYVMEQSHNERQTKWVLPGFWTMFLLSRLLMAVLQHTGYIRPSWDTGTLVVCALLTAVILGNVAGTINPGSARRGLLLIGFCLGPVFPTLVGMVLGRLQLAELRGWGTAYGMLFVAGSLGSLILAPLAAAIARRQTLQSALRIPLFGALLLTAVTLVFGLAT